MRFATSKKAGKGRWTRLLDLSARFLDSTLCLLTLRAATPVFRRRGLLLVPPEFA